MCGTEGGGAGGGGGGAEGRDPGLDRAASVVLKETPPPPPAITSWSPTNESLQYIVCASSTWDAHDYYTTYTALQVAQVPRRHAGQVGLYLEAGPARGEVVVTCVHVRHGKQLHCLCVRVAPGTTRGSSHRREAHRTVGTRVDSIHPSLTTREAQYCNTAAGAKKEGEQAREARGML